jgi:hypothetical protein
MTPPDDQQSSGQEYPSLENAPTPPDGYPPVDYPTDTGTQPPAYPPAYPGPYDVPPSGFPYPGPPQDGSFPQGGYPPPPLPGAPYQAYPGQQYPGQQYPGQQYPGANPYGYDPYRPAQPVGTNGKAIASLVTSLIGLACCMLPGIVGIILGVMAMREIKQTGQEGHGMALAGVIIGGVALAFGAIGIVFMIIFGVLDSTSPYSSYSSY